MLLFQTSTQEGGSTEITLTPYKRGLLFDAFTHFTLHWLIRRRRNLAGLLKAKFLKGTVSFVCLLPMGVASKYVLLICNRQEQPMRIYQHAFCDSACIALLFFWTEFGSCNIYSQLFACASGWLRFLVKVLFWPRLA